MRRLRIALLISVLLHLGLLLLLRGWEPVPAPRVIVESSPVEIEVNEVVVAAPAQVAPSLPLAPAPLPRPRSSSPVAAAPAAPAAPLTPTGERESQDSPRAVALSPRGDLVVAPAPEAPRGRTIHPEDLPSPGELLALKAEQGRGRVQGFAESDLAAARVTSGLVNPYFHALRRELQAGLVKPPEIFDANATNQEQLKQWVSQLTRSWKAGAARYGATGSPYAEPEGYRSEVPDKLSDMISSGARNGGTMRAQQYAGGRLREFADGRAGMEMIAIVQIDQAADGSLKSAVMLQASGVKPFDAWVMRMAEVSVDALKDSPPDGGARSVWEFHGKVSYLQSAKNFDVKQDAWYVLLMLPVGLPGTFDEVTGAVHYVDLRRPHYEATVRLLQAY